MMESGPDDVPSVLPLYGDEIFTTSSNEGSYLRLFYLFFLVVLVMCALICGCPANLLGINYMIKLQEDLMSMLINIKFYQWIGRYLS